MGLIGSIKSKVNSLGLSRNRKTESKTPKKTYTNRIDAREDPKYLEAVKIAENIPDGSRQGQSYGRGLPKGYYVKAGKVHKYDINKDKKIVAKKQIASKNKGKWRGDSNLDRGY